LPADGVYVLVPAAGERVRTVGDVLVETLVAFGITHVFGMVGHSNLGFADAMRRAEECGQLTYIGIRHEGAAVFSRHTGIAPYKTIVQIDDDPAAIGRFDAVTGDGGFGQYAMELSTTVKYRIPVKHVLLDNHSLGKIGKEQRAADFPVWHTSLHNPD
jgi:thiamine pyrophosphate-dependent acetolactate synthase large subunit-like protein